MQYMLWGGSVTHHAVCVVGERGLGNCWRRSITDALFTTFRLLWVVEDLDFEPFIVLHRAVCQCVEGFAVVLKMGLGFLFGVASKEGSDGCRGCCVASLINKEGVGLKLTSCALVCRIAVFAYWFGHIGLHTILVCTGLHNRSVIPVTESLKEPSK